MITFSFTYISKPLFGGQLFWYLQISSIFSYSLKEILYFFLQSMLRFFSPLFISCLTFWSILYLFHFIITHYLLNLMTQNFKFSDFPTSSPLNGNFVLKITSHSTMVKSRGLILGRCTPHHTYHFLIFLKFSLSIASELKTC